MFFKLFAAVLIVVLQSAEFFSLLQPSAFCGVNSQQARLSTEHTVHQYEAGVWAGAAGPTEEPLGSDEG